MKRIWIGIGLLVGLLAAGLITMAMMNQRLDRIAQGLEKASEAVDFSQAVTLAEDANAQWERHKHFHSALADHGDIDTINGSFAQLEVYVRHQDQVSHRATCAWLAQAVKDLSENHRLTWWNLL